MVTDFARRVRLKIETGEKVMIDFMSASVTHTILSVPGVSQRVIQSVLDYKYGYLQKELETA